MPTKNDPNKLSGCYTPEPCQLYLKDLEGFELNGYDVPDGDCEYGPRITDPCEIAFSAPITKMPFKTKARLFGFWYALKWQIKSLFWRDVR